MIISPSDIYDHSAKPAGKTKPVGLRSLDTEEKDDEAVLEVISSPEGSMFLILL